MATSPDRLPNSSPNRPRQAHHASRPASRTLPAWLRLLAAWLLIVTGLAATSHWAWEQPWMAQTRMLWAIYRMPAPTALPMPVQGVRATQVANTFGAPRGGGQRRHEGVDIFARRGTPVLSATPGIVTAVRERGLGGRVVWVLGPGRQRHYYAHLDDWAEGIGAGSVVQAGQMLGTVGDTGNARGTPPHLHYGVYGSSGAIDPLPLLRAAPAP